MKTLNYKKTLAGVLGTTVLAAMLFVSFSGTVSANNGFGNLFGLLKNKIENKGEDKTTNVKIAQPLNPSSDVHLSGNGKVAVAGAKVLSVSGSTMIARVSFGAYNMDWTVVTDGNTKITREKGGTSSLSDVHVGDSVTFAGQINSTATTPTVTATAIRDFSLPTLTQHLFEGTLISLTGSSTPTTAVVKIGGTDYTVNIPSGISVLNKNWQVVNISTYQVGNGVRLYGALQASTTNIIDVTVIRNTSI